MTGRTDMRAKEIAIDIGGTFTDGIALDRASGRLVVAKVPTSRHNPREGFLACLEELLRGSGFQSFSTVVHGTTLVTNTLIERNGSPVALIVSKGTEDALAIGREFRYDLYDLHQRRPEPLVGRDAIVGIPSRLDKHGESVSEITEGELEALGETVARLGIDTVAVCLLHASVNPRHERKVRDYLLSRFPDLRVSLSSDVSRAVREYERMSTVAANAYVVRRVEDYLDLLDGSLRDRGLNGHFRIMTSSGGFTSLDAAKGRPIELLESGPAGGVLGAIATATDLGISRILAFDMGGTTAKACVAVDGRAPLTELFEVDRVQRFKKGSGLPVMVSAIDLVEIGAGGGSIARANARGSFQVGPESAGAAPGPACYGKGGIEPTVTDADLALGYLDPDDFLGGSFRLDRAAAQAALAGLGERLGLDTVRAAVGIVALVNENMAGAARQHIAENGLDPRSLTLVATGGAGPVHAVEVAATVGIERVVVGTSPGAGSCLGFLGAGGRTERLRPSDRRLDELDWRELGDWIKKAESEAAEELVKGGLRRKDVTTAIEANMRYAGQGDGLWVALDKEMLARRDVAAMARAFEAHYASIFGIVIPNTRVEVATWRLAAHGPGARVTARSPSPAPEGGLSAEPGTRDIYSPARDAFVSAAVWRRDALSPGLRLTGPLIVTERETSTVVARDAEVEVAPDGALIVTLG